MFIMATIDVDALRDYLEDYYGTAMFNGFAPALGGPGGREARGPVRVVLKKAEEEGVDLRRFEVEEE